MARTLSAWTDVKHGTRDSSFFGSFVNLVQAGGNNQWVNIMGRMTTRGLAARFTITITRAKNGGMPPATILNRAQAGNWSGQWSVRCLLMMLSSNQHSAWASYKELLIIRPNGSIRSG